MRVPKCGVVSSHCICAMGSDRHGVRCMQAWSARVKMLQAKGVVVALLLSIEVGVSRFFSLVRNFMLVVAAF